MPAASALSNRSLRSVYNYAHRPILRTGLRLVHVQLFLVWIIKISIYPLFSFNIHKFALRPMETWNGYNSDTVKDRCKMFALKWAFSGSSVIFISKRTAVFKLLLLLLQRRKYLFTFCSYVLHIYANVIK